MTAVRAPKRGELVAEVVDRVGPALLPPSPEDRRHEHRNPKNAENQDDRNRQGKRPRCAARRPNITGCSRSVADPSLTTARFAADRTLVKKPRGGRGQGRGRAWTGPDPAGQSSRSSRPPPGRR